MMISFAIGIVVGLLISLIVACVVVELNEKKASGGQR